jgi:hypothetical protein
MYKGDSVWLRHREVTRSFLKGEVYTLVVK